MVALALGVPSARADDVVVHVVGDGRSILERATAPALGWSVVCFAPCRATVPRDGWYRVIGAGRVAPMTLPADAIEVTLGGPATDDYGGLLVAGVGLVSLLVGGAIASFGAFDAITDGLTFVIAGNAVAGAGLIALVSGLLYHYELRF